MGTVNVAGHDFSESEIAAVRNRFPKLTLKQQGVWEGEIDINAVYEGVRIQDSFVIRIIASTSYPAELPVMLEIGGRTERIAAKYKLTDKRDLHYDPRSRYACLCVKQEEKIHFPLGSNLVTFMDNLVVPYLYGLSHFDQYGKWPWGEYSHGGLGILESYAEESPEQSKEEVERLAGILRGDIKWKEFSKQLKKPSSERFCICGSDKPFRKCHPKAWQGLRRFHSDVVQFGMNSHTLLDHS